MPALSPRHHRPQGIYRRVVHLFTGLSRSLLEGAMAGFMDELRDCLANGWTVELGELGYFTPSLSCTRQATDKKELRAAPSLCAVEFPSGQGVL